MATKYVRDMKAAKNLSAYLVLKDGVEVARVYASFGDSGSVLVNVFQSDSAAEASAKAAGAKSVDDFLFQHDRASGYGYDKFTAALAGAWIDGHALTDHCRGSLPLPDGAKAFPKNFTPPAGYRLANWQSDLDGYMSCHRNDGLKYMEAVGYTVIQVV